MNLPFNAVQQWKGLHKKSGYVTIENASFTGISKKFVTDYRKSQTVTMVLNCVDYFI